MNIIVTWRIILVFQINVFSRTSVLADAHRTLLYPSQKNVKTYENIYDNHILISCHFFLFKSVCDIYVLLLVSLLAHSLTLLWQKAYTFHRIYEAWAWAIISTGCACMQKHMYTVAYVRRSIYVRTHTSHEGFFASMERDQAFTNDLALHRHTTFYNQNIPKYLCYVNKDILSMC
jgi:hypothetical protein